MVLSCPVYGQDFSIISNITECKSVFPTVVLEGAAKEIKQTPKLGIKIPSKSKPSWDLLGSMKDAHNKSKMVNHLFSHDNHSGKWTKEFLESLTLGQLWHLHDSDHDKKKSLTQNQKKLESQNYAQMDSDPLVASEVQLGSSASLDKPIKQVLFFTASWCAPCVRFKSSQIPILKKSEWKVSEDKSAMIRIVDIDKNRSLWNKYKTNNSVPQFVLIKNDKKTKTLSGYQSATSVANLYNEK
jgi:thiol-disulfide isomerase/thioredoxin